MNNKNKKLKKENKSLQKLMTWEMKTEMMSKISIKWSCMLRSLPSETNNLSKRRWFQPTMSKKKSRRILWLKLID